MLKISYKFFDSTQGRILIAATANGLCFLEFADDDNVGLSSLYSSFPAASFVNDDTALQAHEDSINSFLENPGVASLPELDMLLGTPFQRQVWNELTKIPAGKTASYSSIACNMGRPTGARAVAKACASNKISLVIPCHRVIGKNGAITGYRWGVERKRKLLEAELSTQHSALSTQHSALSTQHSALSTQHSV